MFVNHGFSRHRAEIRLFQKLLLVFHFDIGYDKGKKSIGCDTGMKIERRLVIGFLGAAGLALAFLCCVFLRSGETAQLNFQEAVRLELSGREADGVEVLTAELPGD